MEKEIRNKKCELNSNLPIARSRFVEHQPIYCEPNISGSSSRPLFVLRGTTTANSLYFYLSFQSVDEIKINFSIENSYFKETDINRTQIQSL